jgi:cytochrome c551/c552
VTISQVYKGKSPELIGFFKRRKQSNSCRRCWTIAMMQANISLTKNMSEEVLKALSDYILSVE